MDENEPLRTDRKPELSGGTPPKDELTSGKSSTPSTADDLPVLRQCRLGKKCDEIAGSLARKQRDEQEVSNWLMDFNKSSVPVNWPLSFRKSCIYLFRGSNSRSAARTEPARTTRSRRPVGTRPVATRAG